MPFLLDTDQKGNRLAFLVRQLCASRDGYIDIETLAQHGLAASCKVQGSPMFARNVYGLFVSDTHTRGLPRTVYNEIVNAYVAAAREFGC